MLDKIFRNIQEKSLKAVSSVYSVLFFVLYFILGLLFIFMDNFPLDMKIGYRVAFGILLVSYAYIGFFVLLMIIKSRL
jgi:uncharacterized membrane protein (DUF485 family)